MSPHHVQRYRMAGISESTEKNYTAETPNIKRDQTKPPMADLPLAALEEVSKVFGYGNAKYEQDNWTKVDVATLRRYVGACLRHLTALQSGERLDPESGLPHLAHACASLLIALHHEVAPKRPGGLWVSAVDKEEQK